MNVILAFKVHAKAMQMQF